MNIAHAEREDLSFAEQSFIAGKCNPVMPDHVSFKTIASLVSHHSFMCWTGLELEVTRMPRMTRLLCAMLLVVGLASLSGCGYGRMDPLATGGDGAGDIKN